MNTLNITLLHYLFAVLSVSVRHCTWYRMQKTCACSMPHCYTCSQTALSVLTSHVPKCSDTKLLYLAVHYIELCVISIEKKIKLHISKLDLVL